MGFRKHLYIWIVVVFFGIIYSLISLVNHYCFRTYALDLGAYTNALYDYIHFQWNDSTVFKWGQENLLADHFDLYLVLLSPFSLIFKTYTLLIAQIFFVLLGGVGVYRYFSLSEKTSASALPAAIFFYLFFGVFAAMAYDYHSNVIAASLAPWFFYLLKKKKLLNASLLLVLILISKENISLWMAFVCAGLAIEYRKESSIRNYLLLGFAFCILYFGTITAWVMPSFANNAKYAHFSYSFLGNSVTEAILHLVTHPIESFIALFTNHTEAPGQDYVKAEMHILVLLSGLPVLFFRPYYVLMLIPIYFQKLYYDNWAVWGIAGQYNIEFAPVMAIGIFTVISDFKNRRAQQITTLIVLLTTLASTIRTMDNTLFYTNKTNIRFYKPEHYTSDYDLHKVHEQLSGIPGDAAVSAQSPFLPHLSLRDHIYQFPMIKDATWIIYSKSEAPYPCTHREFYYKTKELESSPDWIKTYSEDGIVILRKRQ